MRQLVEFLGGCPEARGGTLGVVEGRVITVFTRHWGLSEPTSAAEIYIHIHMLSDLSPVCPESTSDRGLSVTFESMNLSKHCL